MNNALQRTLFVIALVLFTGAGPFVSHAATLSFSAPENVAVGVEFPLYVLASSTEQGFNAAEATIIFPKDMFEVVSVDSTRSATIFNFWLVPPAFSNREGTVIFSGGTTNGVLGSDIPLLTVHMRATGAGTALVTASDASINASDGKGTNILENINSLRISVPQATITIPQKPATPAPSPAPIPEPMVEEGIPANGFEAQHLEKEPPCTGLFANCELPFPTIDWISTRLHEQVGADILVSGTAAGGDHVHLLLRRDNVSYKEIVAVIKDDGTWEGTLSNIFAYGTYSLHAWVESADSSEKSQYVTESNIQIYPPYTLHPFGYVLRWYALASIMLGALAFFLAAFVAWKRFVRRMPGGSWGAEITFLLSLFLFAGMVAWAYVLWKEEYASKTTSWKNTDIPCILRAPSFIDIYGSAQLSIYIDGTPQTIPVDIGFSPECVAQIHTHDDTGRLHFKPSSERPMTLLDFFTVAWVAFNREGYAVEVTVNGENYTDRISSYALQNDDVIEVRYSKLP